MAVLPEPTRWSRDVGGNRKPGDGNEAEGTRTRYWPSARADPLEPWPEAR